MAPAPTVEEVRAWIGIPEEEITDEQLARVLTAEMILQDSACQFWPLDVPNGELPDPLAQALLRRCARAIAARGLPLGSLPASASGMGAEFGLPGPMVLPRLDAEIERYEGPFRITGLA